MSIQLSLYWQSADQIEWYWHGDTDIYKGAIEELQDQKQNRNLTDCQIRLFLPGNWFSTVDVDLPVKSNRITGQLLKFAAEEYLAQDIDSVHLVLLKKRTNGRATLLVTELDRFRQLIKAIGNAGFSVTECFNNEQFLLPEQQTDDIVMLVHDDIVTLCASDQVYNIHARGFAQWFDIWSNQQNLSSNSSIKLISEFADGEAKALASQFEASGLNIQWTVADIPSLENWHEKAQSKKQPGNLITAEFSQRGSQRQFKNWLPTAIASSIALTSWLLLNGFENGRLNQQIEQTWQASENVFLQVFGQSKRIQRPLMVREMRSQAAQAGGGGQALEFNALMLLSDLDITAPSMLLEDMRFNAERSEAFFTLIQDANADADAYSLFEALKTGLTNKGYQVEYSANQDSNGYRAQFKAVFAGQG